MVALAPYVSVDVLSAIVDAAAEAGFDVPLLLQESGIAAEWLREPDRLFVPLEHEQALWQRTCERDRLFGLKTAQSLRRGALDAIEHGIRTSSTVGDGLRLLTRFGRVLLGADAFALSLEGDTAVLSYHGPHPHEVAWSHAATEFALASIFLLMRNASQTPLVPRWVAFRHPQPAEPAAALDLFETEVRYQQPRDEIALDAAVLDTPMAAADPALLRTLERCMIYELHALPNRAATTAAVRRILLEQLFQGPPDLEAVAARLEIHPRTLQARLRDEATTFQALLDDVRREAAERHLRDEAVSMHEIAMLLGYSETSAFHRAFKRWTGVAPGEYRRRHHDVGPSTPHASLEGTPSAANGQRSVPLEPQPSAVDGGRGSVSSSSS